MNFVRFHVAPHYDDSNEQELLQFEALRGEKVTRLRDDEVLLIENNNPILV